MTDTAATPISVFVEGHLKHLLAQDVASWVDLWSDEGVFEFPYAPVGYTQRLDGKAAVANYMAGFPDKIKIDHFDVVGLVQNEAGTEGFLEFTCNGKIVQTGRPYNQHYASFIKVNEQGKVLLYRDFWNPLIVIEAFGGAEALIKAMTVESE